MFNVIKSVKFFSNKDKPEKPKPSYEYKFGCIKSTFRSICLNREIKLNLDNLDNVMRKVMSFENFAKLSRTTNLMKNFLLEDYQRKCLDFFASTKR